MTSSTPSCSAQDILTELTVTLDHDRGGDIAMHLATLYDFCQDRLVRANLTKDLRLVEPVEQVVTELRDTWQAACAAATS